jgi:Kef-type K+ transport system membrane component KefB
MHQLALTDGFDVLFYVGLMFVISQAAGNAASRFDLPRMIGYIGAGILCGPYVLGWYNEHLVETELAAFRDVALAIIAFSIGGALQMQDVIRLRASLSWITVFQTSFASIAVFLAMWWLLPFTNGGPANSVLVVAILLGSVSAATAPAAVMSLIEDYRAKGDFKASLLSIVALDDVIAVVFYTIALAIAGSILDQSNGALLQTLGETSLVIMTEIALGLIVGFAVAKVLPFFSEYRSMLGTLLGIIVAVTGLCLSFGLSPLLTCVMLGFMVTNVAKHELADEATSIIQTVQTPVFGVFFFMAGAHLNLDLALSALAMALVLTLARFAGKYAGTLLGGRMAGTDPQLTRNLGMALLPAAGVMISLTLNARDVLEGQLGYFSDLMVSIVIGATLINEFLTPFFVRHAIHRQQKVDKSAT